MALCTTLSPIHSRCRSHPRTTSKTSSSAPALATSKISNNLSPNLHQIHSTKLKTTTATRSCTWPPATVTRVSPTPYPAPPRTFARRYVDVIAYLLPLVDPKRLSHRNHAGSTALHWAAVNRHLDVAQMLVNFSAGPGVALIDIKNEAGRSPLGEAELAGWDEGARWFVQVMNLDEAKEAQEVEEESPIDPSQAIDVEIQDADGQIAKMTINPIASGPDQDASRGQTETILLRSMFSSLLFVD